MMQVHKFTNIKSRPSDQSESRIKCFGLLCYKVNGKIMWRDYLPHEENPISKNLVSCRARHALMTLVIFHIKLGSLSSRDALR